MMFYKCRRIYTGGDPVHLLRYDPNKNYDIVSWPPINEKRYFKNRNKSVMNYFFLLFFFLFVLIYVT